MSVIQLQQQSATLILNDGSEDHAFTSFIDGDVLELAPKGERTYRTNGTNDSVTIGHRIEGQVWTLTMRVQRYSEDDRFLNRGAMTRGEPIVYSGSLVEEFTRNGATAREEWELDRGSITQMPTYTRQTQEGTEIMEYMIEFRTVNRSL